MFGTLVGSASGRSVDRPSQWSVSLSVLLYIASQVPSRVNTTLYLFVFTPRVVQLGFLAIPSQARTRYSSSIYASKTGATSETSLETIEHRVNMDDSSLATNDETARLALARFIHGTPLGNTGKTEDPVNGELTTKGGSRRLKEKFG